MHDGAYIAYGQVQANIVNVKFYAPTRYMGAAHNLVPVDIDWGKDARNHPLDQSSAKEPVEMLVN